MIRKKQARHASHERWLVSYADFITLLFAFFVVLYASSQVDKRRVGQIAVAIQVAFQQMGVFPPSGASNPPVAANAIQFQVDQLRQVQPVLPCGAPRVNGADAPVFATEDLSDLRKQLQEALAEEIARNEVSIRIGPDGLVVSLREAGFFDSGSAQVHPQAQSALSRIALLLKNQRYRLRIEGHTDNVPIHNEQFASNWELSTARAIEIVRLFITQYGYTPDRLAVAGYGEFYPVSDNATPDGRRNNRRVDVVILAEIKHRETSNPISGRSTWNGPE